jgi:hypothetical protein
MSWTDFDLGARTQLTPRVLHHDADFLIGAMSDEDHAVFLENIAAFERVDESP